jgi:hypothetical protein
MFFLEPSRTVDQDEHERENHRHRKESKLFVYYLRCRLLAHASEAEGAASAILQTRRDRSII